MGENFKFFCLHVQKFSVYGQTLIVIFSVGIRVQRCFPMGMKFQGIFVTEHDILWQIFSFSRKVVLLACDTGVVVKTWVLHLNGSFYIIPSCIVLFQFPMCYFHFLQEISFVLLVLTFMNFKS